MAELADLNPEQIEEYRRYVAQAKQAARNGNLEASIQLFQQALEIHFSEKLTANIKKLEEALASLAVEEEEDDDGFVDVCQSGLMLYGEMHDKLFDYQREGVAFLYKLYRDRSKGGILADDMGLGKTVQIIAFLSGMFDAELIRSVLLILPVTLLNNWEKEFDNWTPGLRVKVFHGTNKAERNRSLEQIQRRKGVLLTTYQMLLNSWPQLSSFGGKEFVWDYIILDEAHKIKTPSAKTTKSVYAIPSKNRILLTGTPVQNNLKELWVLFDFACQGSLLGTSKTFKMEYENPITRARTKDATPRDKALGLKISENLMSIIKPYFLRRTKDELQKKKKAELPNHLPETQSKDLAPTMPSLPRKNEFIIWAFLSPKQEEIYRNFISLDHIKQLLLSTRSPLAELTVLNKLCDHPRLLSNRACSQLGLEASDYSEQDVGENDLSELPDMKRSIGHVSDEMLIQESGKLSFLVALLERLQDEGHRTLVFSLSRKMLDIIERVLTHRGFKLMRIDGTVTQLAERQKRIGMFQKDGDYSVFLLTTQVGGVGLTLTAASRVVIFDPSWNPATDAQAVDRAYRIGQKENVIIYRLITCGTVEEKIYKRQVFKDSLMRQSTGDKKNPYRYFTVQELKELFILEDTGSSATQLQLQSLHATQRKTDTELDEHIAYLHTLEIFGISDHDLMYTHDIAHDEAENEEAHRYIVHRVQIAQELVQQESQLNDEHIRNIRNTTEGAWLRDIDSSTQPKTKPSRSSSDDPLGPSMSERTNPIVVASPIPSIKKSPTPPTPVVIPPVFISPVLSNKVIDLTSNDDNNVVSDMVNLSSKMTSLVVEDMDDEQMLQIISNTEDTLPSEEKEQQFPSFQACELKPGTGPVSPFQTHSVSNKEDYSPESSAISELPAQDKDDEQLVFHTINTDVLHFKNKEYQPTRLQADEQNESLNVVSSLLQATSLSIEGSVNSESKMISCDPSPEARNELKDVHMKLLQDSIAYSSDDGMHQTQADMSLDVLPITHGDACKIKELDAVAPQETTLSEMSESSALQKPDTRETVQFKTLDISSHYQVNFNLGLEDSENGPQTFAEDHMSLEETENVGFQPSLDSYCSSATESIEREHGSHRILQTSNCAEGSVVMDDSNGPCDSSDSFGLGKKKRPAIIVSDEEEENDELIDELDEEKPEGICMSTQKTNRPMAAIYFSPRVKLSGRRSTASRRSLFNLVLEEVEGAAEEAGSKDLQMKLLQDSIVYPDDDMHQTQADMSLDCLHADSCKIKELDAVAPQETMLSKMTESITLQKSDVRETAQFKSLDISSQQIRNTRNTTEGTWVRDIDSSTQPKTKPSRSSSGGPLGPYMSERTKPTVVASPIPSMKKSPTPPTPVVIPPVFMSLVLSNEVIDLTSDDDNDVVSDMVNLSSKMTSLVLEDVDVEQILQNISNTEDALPSEEKEQQFPSFQACELKPGTGPVSPFQTHSVSNKEDCSPESSAISELPAQDKDDEQLVFHTINTDVLHFKNKEYQPTRLQADEQNESLNVVSSLLQATSLSIEGSVNSESKMISCDPSPEARNELKDIHMKLLQDSIAYPSDDGMQQTQADMSLDVLPITHGDSCKIKELDAVVPQETMLSKMTESITLQKSDVRETAQFKSFDISCQQIRNTRNTTEGTWVRDIDSSTQPKTKPSRSSSGGPLMPSMSERTNPTVVASPIPSMKKSPTPPTPVVIPPVFMSPVLSNEVIDLTSDDDNDVVSDMVNLSSIMTSLVLEDVDDEQILQNISNTEDALPSEEKEQQFPSFQACELKPGTGPVSPFQTHSVSNKEDYSPESSAISELPAQDKDDEQLVFHTINTDVLHFKNKEYQPTRLQADEQNESLNVVSSLLQATSLSIEGSVNSESKMISCDPSPEARCEVKDVQMKLLQDSIAYPSDGGMQQTQADMSLDVLPITHGDSCKIKELDAVVPQETMLSKMTGSITLQKSDVRETAQFKSLDISSQQIRNTRNTTEGTWVRDIDSSTQPKTKPSRSSSGGPLRPSMSERTNPTVVASPIPSMKKSPTPPTPVVNPPVFISPVLSNEVIDLTSDDDNDVVSDMVNLSSRHG